MDNNSLLIQRKKDEKVKVNRVKQFIDYQKKLDK